MTKEEKKAYNKAYKKANKDKSKAYNKAYREANKDKLKAYREANKDKEKAYYEAYYEANKDKLNAYRKAYYEAYYEANKDKEKARNKAYREANKDKRKAYYEDNKDKEKARNKAYYEANKDKINTRNRNRKKIDTLFKLKCNIRSRTRSAFKTKYITKTQKTQEMLGCTYKFMRNHLAAQFTKGMTLENYGDWHIDHITPLSSAKNEKELISLAHYTNLQPLWAEDNLKKGDKIL